MTWSASSSCLSRSAIYVLLTTVAITACDPDIPQRPPAGDRVEAVFNPDTGEIPLPNDAAMQDGRLPALPGAEQGTAEGELSNYMTGLSGWPRTTDIEIPFNGALDENTIDDETVRLYRIDGDDLERAPVADIHYRETGDGAGSMLQVVPAAPPIPGAEFAVAVSDRIADTNGRTISPSPVIFMAASPEPMVDDDGNPTLELFADEPETAQTLEQMRLALAPLFEAIEDGVGDDDPIDRDDLATLFRWTWIPDETLAFHPDLGEVPLPNTAALDADGTFPDQGVCHADDDSAQGDFDRFLKNLSGWPVETPLTVTLTHPVDDEAIGDDDVQVWRDDGSGWERIEPIDVTYRDTDIDNCTGEESPAHILDIELGEPMQTHEDYFAFARRDLLSGDGELIPEAPMFLAIQPYDLVDDDGTSVVSTLDDATAQALQQVRDGLAPARQFIDEELGIDHTELAGVWSWYTWNDAFAVFDPERAIPLPNAALLDDDEETMEIPVPDGADPVTEDLIESLNRRSGFSVSSPGWIPIDGELDPDSINFDTFRMLNLGTVTFLEEDSLNLSYEAEIDRLVFEPIVPMPERNLHVGALTDQALGINGRPVQPTPAFVFLRSEHPVYENGQSTVDVLDDNTAMQLQEAQETFQLLFTIAEPAIDMERSELATAWGFRTEDPTRSLREYRGLAHHLLDQRSEVRAQRRCEVDQNCPGAGDDPDLEEIGDQLTDPNDAGVSVNMENVRAVHSGGEFASLDVDIMAGELTEGSERVGLSVYLPEQSQSGGSCTAPYDVAIVQHGFGTDRSRSGLAMANELAAHPGCMATVAMDFPEHGGRTPGASSPHPVTTPQSSGDSFLTTDLPGSKENFVQSAIDLFTLVRIIEGDGADGGLDHLFEDLGEFGPLFGDPTGYVGASLGGIIGIPFVTLEPAIDTVAVNSAGGRLSWLIEGDDHGLSEIGDPILSHLEQTGDIQPGDPEFADAMAFIQWLADRIDPFAFATTALSEGEETLSYDAGSDEFDDGEPIARPEILMQMAVGDRVIVNRGTESLAHALGLSLDDTTFTDVPHAFIDVIDPDADAFDAGECARQQASAWLSSGGDGSAELPGELSATSCVGD